jgi:hypothetical protein
MPTDRANITLFTVPINKGEGNTRAPLHMLIPEEARMWPEGTFDYNPGTIPKTIIFIDDRMLCCTLTTELITLFAKWTQCSLDQGEEPIAEQLVREYHSVLSREALERNLASFRAGECRILVATEAVGMGLDVPDVQRVLQWKVPEFLTVSSWWQRAGRAARKPSVWGLAVAYYEPSLRKPQGSPYWGSRDVETEFEEIKKLLTAKPDGDDPEHAGAEDLDAEPTASVRKRRGNRPDTEESREKHLLWYLNSKGCIREVAMDYFDARPEPRPGSDNDMREPPCCDRCFRARGLDPDEWDGFPVRTTTAFVQFDADSDCDELGIDNLEPEADTVTASQSQKAIKQPVEATKRIKVAVTHMLKIFRVKHGSDGGLLKPEHLLPDLWIDAIVAKCQHITNIRELKTAISNRPHMIDRSLLASKLDLLLTDVLYAVETGHPPLLPVRARGEPWIAADEKPLFSQLMMDAAKPAVAALMRSANVALRKYDLAYISRKESARREAARKTKLSQTRRRQVNWESDDEYSARAPSQADSQITRRTTRSAAAALSQAASIHSNETYLSERSTDRSESSSGAQPLVKRGRGRPRKIPLELPAAERVHSRDETDHSARLLPPPTRRPRGRPRKNLPIQQPTELPSEPSGTHGVSSADDTEDSADLIPPPPAKKPRGRPRKNQPLQQQAALPTVQSIASADDTKDFVDAMPPPAKKPRGRPRKNQPIERSTEPPTEPLGAHSMSSTDDTEDSAALMPPPAKKPRGRPRRNQPLQQPAAPPIELSGAQNIASGHDTVGSADLIPPPAKKPRGRPRKNQPLQQQAVLPTVQSTASADDTKDFADPMPPPAKKPRGRPRKNQPLQQQAELPTVQSIASVTPGGSHTRKQRISRKKMID